MPPKGTTKQPVMELTAIYHAAYKVEFAIQVTACDEILYDDIMSIGT